MPLTNPKRVKWSVNERADHNDVVGDQTGVLDRFRALLAGLFASQFGTAAGTKGLVLRGFGLSAGAAGHVQIVGEGAALDVDGNLITKPATPDFDQALADGTYYAHVYYREVDGDNANRKFWDPAGGGGSGAETTVAVDTRTESTYGAYFGAAAVDTVPVTGEKAVVVGRFQLVGGAFTLLADLRPTRQMIGETPLFIADRDLFAVCFNLTSLSVARGATRDDDVFTANLRDNTRPGVALCADMRGLTATYPAMRWISFDDGPNPVTGDLVGGFSIRGNATVTGVLTVQTTLNAIGTADRAPINIQPALADPTNPQDGDIWFDDSANALRMRGGGATQNLNVPEEGDPVASSNYTLITSANGHTFVNKLRKIGGMVHAKVIVQAGAGKGTGAATLPEEFRAKGTGVMHIGTVHNLSTRASGALQSYASGVTLGFYTAMSSNIPEGVPLMIDIVYPAETP